MTQIERRTFLKSAAKTMLAAPALPLLSGLANAEPTAPVHPVVHKSAAPPKPAVKLNVRDLGATGDGTTKDTLAIQQTIERCSVFGGGEVIVPAGDYLTGALALRSGVTLRIEEGATLNGSTDLAVYPLAQVRWEGHWIKGYTGFISATDAQNIAIVGKGKIIGNPTLKGRVDRATKLRYPALMEFNNCKNVRVEDVYTQQFGMWSTHPVYCENVTFKNVTFKSAADGIDVDSCKHVIIDGCNFDTGDDSISLKSGRGAEGNLIGRVCEEILITNCTFSDTNFANIGIGSETSGGVRNVRIEHCKFISARSHAIYIKSRVGRGAFVENVSVNDIDVSGMRQGFLRIQNISSGISDGEASVMGLPGIPSFRNFRFSNVRVTDVPTLVSATEMHPLKPLDGLTLTNITGTCAKGIALVNVKNAHLSGIKVTGFTGPLLSTAHVTGTGLTGAVPIEGDGPKLPDELPVPATPYQLH
ncbi:MAG: glycoside hydrolase family 28 protein [Acidobacteriota bacterium]|nr:glycoside hydrolase family 28 protein [Acidobacteriota bacterium]